MTLEADVDRIDRCRRRSPSDRPAAQSSGAGSILSASRALCAVSRDRLVPSAAGRVNLRYETPHIEFALVGGPVVVLVATGQTELLPEVTNFLYLIMYGLICIALVAIRRSDPDWYEPSFRTPGYPLVPILGAVSSFGLILFMQRSAQLIGLAVMLGSLAWYGYYARDVRLKGVSDHE